MKGLVTPEETKILDEVFSRSRGGLDSLLCSEILDKIKSDLGEKRLIPWANSFFVAQERLLLLFQVVEGLKNNLNFEKKLNVAYDLFTSRMQKATAWFEKRGLMLDLLYEIDLDKKRQEIDSEALQNRLDLGGIIERYRLAIIQQRRYQEKRLCLIAELLSDVITQDLKKDINKVTAIKNVLAENNLEQLINTVTESPTNWMPKVAALSIYQKICQHLNETQRENTFLAETISLIIRQAKDSREDIWVQRENLQLVKAIYPDEALSLFEQRLTNPTINFPEEIFVYAEIVRLLGQGSINERNITIVENLLKTPFPSEHVRLEIVKTIAKFPLKLALEKLSKYTKINAVNFEPCEQVRATAIEELSSIAKKSIKTLEKKELNTVTNIIDDLTSTIKNDPSSFVRRVAMEEIVFIVIEELNIDKYFSENIQKAITAIDSVIESEKEIPSFRRIAWQYRERIVIKLLPDLETINQIITKHIEPLFEGEQVKIPLSFLQNCSLDNLSRVLANKATDDFGYFIKIRKNHIVIQKGERWGISFWRVLHEIRNPAPDKRKGAYHSIGRKPFGSFQIPSQILAELTKTRVPGEPLFIEIEGGWRPFIPLLTDFLELLSPYKPTQPMQFFTSLGITKISCRLNYLKRVKAWLKLSWNFEKIADLRNVGLDGRNLDGPVEYLQILSQEYGVDFHYQPYQWQPQGVETPKDPSLKAISSIAKLKMSNNLATSSALLCLVPLIANTDQLWDNFQEYFFNLLGNSNFDLWIFFFVSMIIFLGRQILIFRKIRLAINNIPLVFGGWGTRGKSGTERKKAALFHGMGYQVFSKTTGCEAMFLHTAADTRAAEIFLYRPYDKASIWEMGHTAIMAEKLKAEVYLWECMALNPRFVKLLQKQWMKDDIATITNTYPDHEDIQGPAGIDIPRVMTNFLPTNRPAYTSEDQMLPILRDAAKKCNSTLHEVNWREPLMFTKDILDIFPYKVHPRNLALVLKSFEAFNLDRDFILKEMSEHIVPDLGVLKTYPVAEVFERKLEFTNAMSANERRGFNDSWRRAGHSQHSDEKSPETWIITVINNRADRIPRSQVFAEVAVADAFAHRHVLIGTNLNGLYGYISQALERRLAEINFYNTSAETSTSRQELAKIAFKERLNELKAEAFSPALIAQKTKAMLSDIELNLEILTLEIAHNDEKTLPKEFIVALEKSNKSEEIKTEITTYLQQWHKRLKQIEKIYQLIDNANTPNDEAKVLQEFRNFARELFISKLVVVENALSTGDEVIARIAKSAPPGFFVRVMGMQNIKGTGLDFVYRWLALEKIVENSKYLKDKNERLRLEAIGFFTYFQEYGLITREPAIKALKEALELPINQKPSIQQRLEAALNVAQTQVKTLASEKNKSSLSWLNKIFAQIETFLESSDSKDRRNEANKVMADLMEKTISHERAAVLLRDITLRQKGGWLSKKFWLFRNCRGDDKI